ncbi:MFS general substrate transporter [Trichoderma aethiopicum]
MASSNSPTESQSQSTLSISPLHPPTDDKLDLEPKATYISRDTHSSSSSSNNNSPPEPAIAANIDPEKQAPLAQDADSSDDENLVWWDGDDDPENPYNWSASKKVLNSALISALSFITPLASSMFAPGVPDLMKEFHSTSEELAAFCVSVYVLGFAAGPMLFAPLSELYGRSIIYNITNVGFIVFVIACAQAPSMTTLIIFRFLSGIFGSCPITNGGGSITDMIRQDRRGAAMACFAIGPLLGPVVGPVVGGFITTALGWRWVFYIMAILSGTLALLYALCARETYASVLLRRKADRLRRRTNNPLLRSKLDPGLSHAAYLKRGILRPFKMLVLSPISIICGVYVGVVYAYLYLLFTSLTPLFMEIYHFKTSYAGLTFLGIGFGSMIGVAFFSLTSDRNIKRKAAEEALAAEAEGRAPEGMKPEYRLSPLMVGAVVLPVGFFIYGWTAEYKVHWIAPIIGTVVIGVGDLIVYMSLQMYLVDTFTVYAASALAANAVIRSVAGAVLPLAGLPMYNRLGMGWGNSILGFIGVALSPVAWLFLRHGERLRKRFEIKNL